MSEISVVIPLRNEYSRIISTIKKIDSYLRTNFSKYEVLIVDDASTDGTTEAISKIKLPNISSNHFNVRMGKGKSIAYGILHSKYNKVVYIDADLQGLNSIKNIFYLLDKCDIVIGDRYISSSKTNRTLKRKFVSYIFNLLVNMLLGSKLKDHQCGLKGFKKSKKLSRVINSVKSTHWFWDTELLVKAQWAGLSICTVPVEWEEGKDSHVEVYKDGTYMLKEIFRLFLERITRR